MSSRYASCCADAVAARRTATAITRGARTNASAPVVEGGRVDVQRAQVYVALAAVMNLIVDDVQNEVVQHVLVLTEGRDCLLEPLRRDLRPQGVELVRTLIPELEDPMFRPRIAAAPGAP